MIVKKFLKISSFIPVLLLLTIRVHFAVLKPTELNVNENSISVNDDEIVKTLHNPDDDAYLAKYAQEMMSYMNNSVDPCDDFYEYACGNWHNLIEEKFSKTKRSNFQDLKYKLQDALEQLLNTPNLTTQYEAEWQLTKQFYESCLKADLYNFKKSQDYLDVINAIGGFPAVDETWQADSFSWFNMSAHLTNYDIAGFIYETKTFQHPFGPGLQLPELGFDIFVHSDNIVSNISQAYMLNEKRMRDYLTIYDVEESKITQIIADIFDLWKAIFEVTATFDENLAVCEMLALNVTFDQWENYLDIAWGREFNLTEWFECDIYYIEIDKICNERKEAAANYLALKFLYHMDARLTDPKFQKGYCQVDIKTTLPYLIDKLYMDTFFDAGIRDEVKAIVMGVRTVLRELLEHDEWLDEPTREEALLKETTITERIGHLDDPEMMHRLIGEMGNLTFNADNYEINNINLRKFRTFMKRYLGLHPEDFDNSTKPMELLLGMQANAFYYAVDNSINVMAGMLYPPAYHKSWPNALKFGTLGFFVGHEFTHAFDSFGSKYDSEGLRRNWWTEESRNMFDELGQCYIDHFNGYLVPEINRHIDGNRTNDENIADSGGLREALTAYRRYMKDVTQQTDDYILQMEQERLPGLDMTPEQIFFLGFAQCWCASYKEEHYWAELTDEHTIDKYRVLGSLTNFEDFAKAFQCPLGSKMNPTAEKCRLW